MGAFLGAIIGALLIGYVIDYQMTNLRREMRGDD